MKAGTRDYMSLQNAQLSRIFRLADPLVDLVLVVPFELQHELLPTYLKQLEASGVENADGRLHVLTPSLAALLAKNQLSLSCLLSLCTDTVARIAEIVAGRKAYFVTGTPSFHDVTLATQTGIPILTGNPVVSLKFMSGFYTKRFLHVNSFPSMVFSQKIKTEDDIRLQFAKLAADNPGNSLWRLEIDGEVHGRGFGLVDTNQMSLWQSVKSAAEPAEPAVRVAELASHLKRHLAGYLYMSNGNLYTSFDKFKAALLARGGFVEAVPRGKLKTIGVLCFISPAGSFKVLTSYEVLQTDRFLRLGYLWPQRDVALAALEALNKKLAQKLFDQGVFGYVTLLLTVSAAPNKQFKLCVDRVLPYYDEFAAAFETLSLMLPPDKPGSKACAVVLPRIQAMPFAPSASYFRFFEKCRERNVHFDLKTREGTIFMLYDALPKGLFGLISAGSFSSAERDRETALKCASRALTSVAGLFEGEKKEDADVQDDAVTFSMVMEQLFNMQKPL